MKGKKRNSNKHESWCVLKRKSTFTLQQQDETGLETTELIKKGQVELIISIEKRILKLKNNYLMLLNKLGNTVYVVRVNIH